MMRSTGVVRKVDELGRIVIPKEIRDRWNIRKQDPIEFFVSDSGDIVLRQYKPGCSFCNSMDELMKYRDEMICKSCIDKISKLNADIRLDMDRLNHARSMRRLG